MSPTLATTKIVSLLAAGLLVLTAAGCSSGKSSSPSNPASAASSSLPDDASTGVDGFLSAIANTPVPMGIDITEQATVALGQQACQELQDGTTVTQVVADIHAANNYLNDETAHDIVALAALNLCQKYEHLFGAP